MSVQDEMTYREQTFKSCMSEISGWLANSWTINNGKSEAATAMLYLYWAQIGNRHSSNVFIVGSDSYMVTNTIILTGETAA